MSGTIDEIKSKLDIVSVVSSYLKLDKAGGNLKAKCPFHNEKTPSFFVSPARESFHCFGCGKGGDIFEFVKEMEGVEFVDALKILAERSGVPLKREDNLVKSDKGRLISAVENAAIFYAEEIQKNREAIGYLKKRGLSDETIKSFQIGFAADSWRALYDHLKSLKFSDSEIERAGLIIKSPKGYYDRFRNRIIFPISNISGTVVGFSGRIMPGATDVTAAKYINSPQTDLYDKSKILFGFDRGRVAMRTSDSCVLVEGQMDLVMSHQSGNFNTVAVSGTALTEEHLKSIKRLANRLILAFDGDEAGFKASSRGMDMALAMGMDVRVARLPDGVDPADLILEDPAKWSKAIGEAEHIVDFYMETLTSRGYEPRELKIKVENLVLPYVARIKSNIEQAHFVDLIARSISIGEEPIWETIKTLRAQSAPPNIRSVNGVANTGLGDKDGNIAPPRQDSRSDSILRRIMGIILWQKELRPDDAALQKAEEEVKRIVGDGKYALLKEVLKSKSDSLIFEAEVSFGDGQNVLDYLGRLILNLNEETLKESLNDAIFKLKKAELASDQDEVARCLELCQKLGQELEEVKRKNI